MPQSPSVAQQLDLVRALLVEEGQAAVLLAEVDEVLLNLGRLGLDFGQLNQLMAFRAAVQRMSDVMDVPGVEAGSIEAARAAALGDLEALTQLIAPTAPPTAH